MQGIYFDFAATTPIDVRVQESMMPFFIEKFGNAASNRHQWGWQAAAALEKARAQVAKFFSVTPSEVIFTSGATESNNWVVRSLVERALLAGKKPHLISSPAEHKSILASLNWAKKWGAEVEFLTLNREGRISLEELSQKLKAETTLVTLMAANNEIGTVYPLDEIRQLCQVKKVLFHTDATQAAGKILQTLWPADFISISAHKIYGPKGIGALIARKEAIHHLSPLIDGGGQEMGLRGGTVNIPGAVGLGMACEIASKSLETRNQRLQQLRELLWQSLASKIPGLVRNSPEKEALPNLLHLSFPFDLDFLESCLLGVSGGSACSSTQRTSHVLNAIGLPESIQGRSLRFTLGDSTLESDILSAVDRIANSLKPHLGTFN